MGQIRSLILGMPIPAEPFFFLRQQPSQQWICHASADFAHRRTDLLAEQVLWQARALA